MYKSTQQLPTSTKITKQFLKHLYETKCAASEVTPILQILAFEESFHEHSEITVRLSDGVVFIDCSLVGSYSLSGGKIVSVDVGPNQVEFFPNDLVKLTDFFSKIDSRRICELRVMVRKMELAERCDMRIGLPSELRQFFENKKEAKTQPNEKENTKTFNNESLHSPEANKPNIIKIEEDPKDSMVDENDKKVKDEPNRQIINSQASKNNQTLQNGNQIQKSNNSEKDLPLTFQEIIDGKEGYFIGRLLRMKMANKETKDGPMSVLYLGFVDRVGELVRVNMAGRLALKEEKELKKGKCYFIKDLETYQTEKMPHPQIRLKDKEYKILEVQQPNVTETFARSYFHWDHENDQIESDNVDIIGIIDEIEDKTSYPHSNERREVVRVVVRNKYKTAKINFWAEQIKVIAAMKLKKKDAIVLEDIKKKKNIFLDYQYESSILKLEDVPTLKESLKDLLPNSLEAYCEPKNIHELEEIYDDQSNPNKVLYFRLFLSRIQENRIIYKLCSYCKEKVEKFAETCAKCEKNEFYFKFNCQLEFADYSGSLCCVAFEFSAQKIFGKNAFEINEMDKDELMNFINSFIFQEYDIGLENKNGKLVIRSAEPMESAKQYIRSLKGNLSQIRKILNKNRSD